MPLTGEEIRANLTRFVARWSVREGYERGEAQTFLTELFDCYGQRLSDVAEFERFQAGGFIDLIWPRICIVEMKSASEAGRLSKHREQALNYWREAADAEKGIPAPEYVVLCAFKRFEVWEPGRFPKAPRVKFDLTELPDRYTSLLFLTGGEPVFNARQEGVTLEAVGKLADLFQQIEQRGEGDPQSRRRFILQTVWCMFAEDLGQIPGQGFTRVVDDLIANPRRSSADDLGRLFEYLNDPSPERPQHGLYAGVPYANGSLFAEPSRIDLTPEELALLREVSASNWHEVQPSIFGSLLQGVFGHDKQWRLGAHYTHDAEIQKIVVPTIVEPWTERIEALSSHKEAKLMNRWKRLPWWSTIFAVLAVLVIAIAGCGADESSTTATEAKKEEEDSAKKAGAESNPDRVARSYAREVSGGKWEYGGLSSAAYGGCLEALLGKHVGTPGVSYKDEFPEPELQAIYERALRDCS